MTPAPADPILKMYFVPRVFNGPHSRDTHCKGPGGHTRRREIPHVRDFVFGEPEMDASRGDLHRSLALWNGRQCSTYPPGTPPLVARPRASRSRHISSVRDAHLGFGVLVDVWKGGDRHHHVIRSTASPRGGADSWNDITLETLNGRHAREMRACRSSRATEVVSFHVYAPPRGVAVLEVTRCSGSRPLPSRSVSSDCHSIASVIVTRGC